LIKRQAVSGLLIKSSRKGRRGQAVMSDKFWKCIWWTCRHEIDGQKDEPCPYCRIEELESELQTANEMGAKHAKRVGEQALELQALLKESE
jgi:hypothetical protein